MARMAMEREGVFEVADLDNLVGGFEADVEQSPLVSAVDKARLERLAVQERAELLAGVSAAQMAANLAVTNELPPVMIGPDSLARFLLERQHQQRARRVTPTTGVRVSRLAGTAPARTGYSRPVVEVGLMPEAPVTPADRPMAPERARPDTWRIGYDAVQAGAQSVAATGPDASSVRTAALHPGLPTPQWLFADDAGVGRPVQRLKSHDLRAPRGAGKKRLAQASPLQGTLFTN